jgi:uncharacterized protein YggU (UPF0235/DUF167 family)
MSTWVRADDEGCIVTVRVIPRASRPGVVPGPDGPHIRVSAPPAEGRATAEAVRLLAAALGVRPGAVTLRTGRRGRTKAFHVAGVPPDRAVRLLGSAG